MQSTRGRQAQIPSGQEPPSEVNDYLYAFQQVHTVPPGPTPASGGATARAGADGAYIRVGSNSYDQGGWAWNQDGGYMANFRAALAAGHGGSLQPIVWHGKAYLRSFGVVQTGYVRQPFPTAPIKYPGALPTSLQSTVNKPAPWSVAPYNFTPFAPPGG